VGPPLGAYFASLDLLEIFPVLRNYHINSYSSPALFAFILIIIETAYMYVALPETLDFKNKQRAQGSNKKSDTNSTSPITESKRATPVSASASKKSDYLLNLLSLTHFLFLFFFSGMEFTLTFLTHDRFHFTHLQQGRYLGFMGVLAACVQGGYVRRVAHRSVTEKTLVLQGMVTCAIGLAIVGFFAKTEAGTDSGLFGWSGLSWMYVGASFLAFTSGTVVTSLTSLASLVGSGPGSGSNEVEVEANDQGRVLGKFRALGQLGRAIGPLVACSGYWVLGSQMAYGVASMAMASLVLFVSVMVPKGELTKKKVNKTE
jgi:hypothetical protein